MYVKLIGLAFLIFITYMVCCIRCQLKGNSYRLESLENEIAMLKGEVNFVANEMQNKEEMKEDHKGREGREGRDLEQEKRDYQQEKRDLEQ